jgi:predicted transcriptional regulator
VTAELSIFRSELQARLLGLVLLDADRTWTARELAARLDATSVSIHRELHRLLDAGLLTREAIGRTYLYRAATESPLYEPLRLLVERTVGVEAELRRALETVPGVEAAFIHGSFAQRTKVRPGSDVDVLVLGDVDPHLLRRCLRRVGQRLGREIDVLAYREDEFASLAERGNSLVRGIIRGPVTPLVGSADALRRVA